MEGDDKEVKAENKETEKTEHIHSHNHGLKVVLIVVVFLLVVGGIAGAAKLAFLRRSFGQVNIERDTVNRSGGYGGGMTGGRGMHQRIGSGIIGRITKIDGNNLTVHKDSNNKDYTVIIADTTQIQKNGDIASKSDLTLGLAITVQGNANSSGQIAAIRIIIN